MEKEKLMVSEIKQAMTELWDLMHKDPNNKELQKKYEKLKKELQNAKVQ